MSPVLLFILGVVFVAIGVAVSIALHEVGHLVPAKLFKVRVTKYMIGFGPTLWSKKKGETEYGFKALPLGGYVSMIGMYPPNKEDGAVRPPSSTGMFQTLATEARSMAHEEVGPGGRKPRLLQASCVEKDHRHARRSCHEHADRVDFAGCPAHGLRHGHSNHHHRGRFQVPGGRRGRPWTPTRPIAS